MLYAFGGGMVGSWIVGMPAPQDDDTGIATIAGRGVLGVCVLIVTAAVTEEIACRGCLAERIGALLGRSTRARWDGAAIALIQGNLAAAMPLRLLVNLPLPIPTILG